MKSGNLAGYRLEELAARRGRLSQWKPCHRLTRLQIGFPNLVAHYALTNFGELEGLFRLDLALESFDRLLLDECGELDHEIVDLRELYHLFLVPDRLGSLQLDDFGQRGLLHEKVDSNNPHDSRYLRHGLLNFLSF